MTRKDCVGFVALAAVLLTAAVAQPQTADGGFQTGTELYLRCVDPSSLTCYGYLMGAADALRTIVQELGGSCGGLDGKSALQLRLEILKAIQEHPQDLHLSASRYVMKLTGCTLPDVAPTTRRKDGKLIPPETPTTMQ